MTTKPLPSGHGAGGAGQVSGQVADRLLMMIATGVLRRRPPVVR